MTSVPPTRPPAAPETDVRVPVCSLGYPREQVEQLLAEEFAAFAHWMRGQTMATCDGRRYDHDAREYQPTGCGPHGVVVYPWDVDNYLRGGRIND